MRNLLNYVRYNPLALLFVSAAVSVVAYSILFGFFVSLGFVISLFIHEMGHYYAAKHQKIKTSMPVFIPFVGALINFKEQPYTAEQEAFIGIGGPIAGTLAAIASYIIYMYTGNHAFLVIASLGFMLNLFNLVPLTPLDGGRTVTVISPYIWLVGIAMAVAALIYFQSIILLIVIFVGIKEIRRVLFTGQELSAYYRSKISTKIIYSIVYLGLIVFLTIALSATWHNIFR